VYAFAYHRSKLQMVRSGTLDDKRRGDTKFRSLADFLENAHARCPHDLFRRGDGARGSELAPTFVDPDGLIIEKNNVATDTAALIIPSVGSNHERHAKLQRFMLVNDSTTVAVEVPIWLDENDIEQLEATYGTELLPRAAHQQAGNQSEGSGRLITGHIDFLQVRNGAVHILDYKPDARTNKPIAQLTIYALALTRLVPGLRLFDIKCAWFNESSYNEFFPRTLLPHSKAGKR